MDSNETSEETGWSAGLSLAEQVKAAAEEAVSQSGFVYNEETGLYYDSNTQLYYSSETGLYYNGYTGTWYRFDETVSDYVVHHQIEGFTFENAVAAHVYSTIDSYTTELAKKVEAETKREKEDGELTDSGDDEKDGKKRKLRCEAHRLAEALPPCARLLVIRSSVSNVNVGALFVIPYTGGTIGRVSGCDVYLDDINISKEHAKLVYNDEEKSYTIQDLGSRNGTFVNSQRLSELKEVSDVYILAHDSHIQIGGVILLCHIHAGLETCDDCEPGLVIQNTKSSPQPEREDLEKARKRELKKIRQKFGLESHEPDLSVFRKPGYQDRAEVRRQTVGVDPVGAKTEAASTETPIAPKNKGFQMLVKMGWSQGQGLGKSEADAGSIEPISVEVRGREGLGMEVFANMADYNPTPCKKRRAEVLQKTKERFSQL